MTWALVATVGAATANAYDTAANADTYFATHPLFRRWDRLATAEKERYLVLASRQIDQMPIAGEAATSGTTAGVPNQGLRFPRAQDRDAAGLYVPRAVKWACFEQAVHVSQQGASTSKRRTLQQEGVTEVTFGDVTEKYDLSSSGGSSELCPRAYQMLSEAGLLMHSMGWSS